MHDTYTVFAPSAILTQVPLVVVLIAGLLLSGVRRRRHPTISLRVALALILLLLGLLGSRLLPLWLSRRSVDSVEDFDRFRRMIFIGGLAMNLLAATAVALFLWAAFGGRPIVPSSPEARESAGDV